MSKRDVLGGLLAVTNLAAEIHRNNTARKVAELELESEKEEREKDRKFRREELFLDNSLKALNTRFDELNDKKLKATEWGILDNILDTLPEQDKTIGAKVLTSQNVEEIESGLNKISNQINSLDKGINQYTEGYTSLGKDIDSRGNYDGTVTEKEINDFVNIKTNPRSPEYDPNFNFTEIHKIGINAWNLDPKQKMEMDLAEINLQTETLKLKMLPKEYANKFALQDIEIDNGGLNTQLLTENVIQNEKQTKILSNNVAITSLEVEQLKNTIAENKNKKDIEGLRTVIEGNLALQTNMHEELHNIGDNLFMKINFSTGNTKFTPAYTLVATDDPDPKMKQIKKYNLYIGGDLSGLYTDFMTAFEDENIAKYQKVNNRLLTIVPHVKAFRDAENILFSAGVDSELSNYLKLGYTYRSTYDAPKIKDGVVVISNQIEDKLIRLVDKNAISLDDANFIINNIDSIARGYEWAATGIIDAEEDFNLLTVGLPTANTNYELLKDQELSINQEIYSLTGERFPGVINTEAINVLDTEFNK